MSNPKVIGRRFFPVDRRITLRDAVRTQDGTSAPFVDIAQLHVITKQISSERDRAMKHGRDYVMTQMVMLAQRTMTVRRSGKERAVRKFDDISESVMNNGSIDNFEKFYHVGWGQFEAALMGPWERTLEEKYMSANGLTYSDKDCVGKTQSIFLFIATGNRLTFVQNK